MGLIDLFYRSSNLRDVLDRNLRPVTPATSLKHEVENYKLKISRSKNQKYIDGYLSIILFSNISFIFRYHRDLLVSIRRLLSGSDAYLNAACL